MIRQLGLDRQGESACYIRTGCNRHRYFDERSRTRSRYAIAADPAAFHILLALADEERHGYGIMQALEVRTSGQVRLGPGTHYDTIKRMLADRLIGESDERPDPAVDNKRRRYYRLTQFERRRVVEAEAAVTATGPDRQE